MKKTLILLSGYKGSGKDSIASAYTFDNPNSVSTALAQDLKQSCSELFNIPLQDFHSIDKKDKKNHSNMLTDGNSFKLAELFDHIIDRPHYDYIEFSPRSILIAFGSLCRFIDAKIWCRRLYNSILTDEHPIIIITDLRMKNELDFFKSKQSEELKVIHVRVLRASKSSNDPTETELENVVPDYAIDNTGDIFNSVRQLQYILKKES